MKSLNVYYILKGFEMANYSDALGDKLKAFEAVESLRMSEIGNPVVVRVDGVSFSKFTKKMERPFDERFFEAMTYATKKVVEDFNCRIGYTQSDEMSFILWDEQNVLPYGGRLQKLASRFAAKATAYFLLKALELFPEDVERHVPEFDGRSMEFPSLDLATKSILWRELDARKNAVSMAVRSHYPSQEMQWKSSSQMRKMLLEKGVDFLDYPERFRRGAFYRREVQERLLEPEELARIPEKHRPNGPVMRSRVAEVEIPNLATIENLSDVLIFGKQPVYYENTGLPAQLRF